MELTELYQKGGKLLGERAYGKMLGGMKTEFDIPHDRAVFNRHTFRMRCIDAVEASTRKMLLSRKKITEDLIDMMMSWRHSGFNVYCGHRIQPGEEEAMENLARYIIRRGNGGRG